MDMSKIWDMRKVDFLKQVGIYYSADVFLPIDNKNNITNSLQKENIQKYEKLHTVKLGYNNHICSLQPRFVITSLICVVKYRFGIE